MQIAQSTRTFLDVWLKAVGCIGKLGVTLANLEHFPVIKRPRIGCCAQFLAKRAIDPAAAAQVASLQQTGLDGDVDGRLGQALLDGAHAVPDHQADIPALANEGLDALDAVNRLGIGHQDHQVDVGMQLQLAPTISAHRCQAAIGGHIAVSPEGDQASIGDPDHAGQQAMHLGSLPESRDQFGTLPAQLGAHRGGFSRLARGFGVAHCVRAWQKRPVMMSSALLPRRRAMIRRPQAAGSASRGKRPTWSGLHGRCRSPARCVPIGLTGCDPGSRWSSHRTFREFHAGRR